MIIEKAKREKVEGILKKIAYRNYQAGIALASHDKDWLRKLAKKFETCGKEITKALSKKKKAEANGKCRSNKISKTGNKKALR